jgi:S1-C subfamily serine protease
MTTNYPYFDPAAAPQPVPPPTPPPAPQSGLPRRRRLLAGGIATLTAAAVVGVLAFAGHGSTVDGVGSATRLLPTVPGHVNRGQNGRSTSVGLATAAQQKGVVTVVSVLRYQNAESAGTGMILTSNGEILTNNHVINGATSVSVTDIGNGKSYQATVVGYDESHDIAVLQLSGASGLTTATTGDSSTVGVGNSVVALGNAGGVGGTPSVAAGSVTALNQSITASEESSGSSEQLTGLIETNADIQAGDSGGPLVNAYGQVIGMDTAASSGFQFGNGGPGNGFGGSGNGFGDNGSSNSGQDSGTQGFAIPINTALSVASQIEGGHASSTVHIGATAFLGLEIASSNQQDSSGVALAGVAPGTPAATAGLGQGDVITSLGGQSVSTGTDIQKILVGHHPGDKISIGWTDPSGQSHTATVTLTSGPTA